MNLLVRKCQRELLPFEVKGLFEHHNFLSIQNSKIYVKNSSLPEQVAKVNPTITSPLQDEIIETKK